MPTVELISRADNVAQVRVALATAEVDRAYKDVYKRLAQQVNVPGFRKGKTPANILRQRLGADAIAGEVDDRLREFAVGHALQELSLTPRGSAPRFSTEGLPREGAETSYEFSLPVLPEIKLPEYRGWTIDVKKVEVDDELRTRYRQRLVDRFTKPEPKDGAAESGDLITIGIHSKLEDGSESPFGGHDIGYVPGREGNLPGMDEELLGLSAGATKDFNYTMPDDFADARVAGKTLAVHVHVDKVETLTVPELTDEFVKEQLGMERGAEELAEYMETSLAREAEAQLEQVKKEAAMDRVVAELEADISADMLKDEVDGIVTENDRTLRRSGSSLDTYLQQKGQSLGEYRESLTETAQRRIRFFLAAKAIADREGFEATGQDLQRYALYLMQREGIPPEQFRELLQNREFASEATYQIVLEKVLQHLADSITFNVA